MCYIETANAFWTILKSCTGVTRRWRPTDGGRDASSRKKAVRQLVLSRAVVLKASMVNGAIIIIIAMLLYCHMMKE